MKDIKKEVQSHIENTANQIMADESVLNIDPRFSAAHYEHDLYPTNDKVDQSGADERPEYITLDEWNLIGEMVEGSMNGVDWFTGKLVEVIDLFIPYKLEIDGEIRGFVTIRESSLQAQPSAPANPNAMQGLDSDILKNSHDVENQLRSFGDKEASACISVLRDLVKKYHALATAVPADMPASDAASIKQPGWHHVGQAFIDGAREARINPDAQEADFFRAADGYSKQIFERVDPESERRIRENDWPADPSIVPINSILDLINKAIACGNKPMPDPIAHSHEAYARALHNVFCDMRFKLFEVRSILLDCAAPQQPVAASSEPVAWIWKYANGEEEVVFIDASKFSWDYENQDVPSKITPLYVTPQPFPAPAVEEPIGQIRTDIERSCAIWFGTLPPHGTMIYAAPTQAIAQTAPAVAGEAIGLAKLHDELNTLKWMGADKGWDLAIDAVCKRIRELVAAPAKGAKQ